MRGLVDTLVQVWTTQTSPADRDSKENNRALVNVRDMLDYAHRNDYAVGAFDLVSLNFLDGIMDTAERCRTPVILSLAESHLITSISS